MDLTRREFVVGAAACASGWATGCAAVNPAPTFQAGPDGTLPLPDALAQVGSQVKIILPGADGPLLLWRTSDGYRATSITCTHRGSEVHLNAAEGTLDCPSHGSRFKSDGSVLHGPARLPLRAYSVEAVGDRLKIHA
jgi:nitrite reductase/ring-hydroxylating ferredoxin subunit